MIVLDDPLEVYKKQASGKNRCALLGYRTLVLPSSSALNRMNQENRLRMWKRIVQ
jgi:hypothetical protein